MDWDDADFLDEDFPTDTYVNGIDEERTESSEKDKIVSKIRRRHKSFTHEVNSCCQFHLMR